MDLTKIFNIIDSLNVKIQEAGKITMVLMVNEAKGVFTKGMSEKKILTKIYGTIPEASRTKEGTNYFKQVYSYLIKGMSDDNILKNEDGKSMSDLCNLAKDSKHSESALVNNNSRSWDWEKILKVLGYILQIILAIWF